MGLDAKNEKEGNETGFWSVSKMMSDFNSKIPCGDHTTATELSCPGPQKHRIHARRLRQAGVRQFVLKMFPIQARVKSQELLFEKELPRPISMRI